MEHCMQLRPHSDHHSNVYSTGMNILQLFSYSSKVGEILSSVLAVHIKYIIITCRLESYTV